MTLRQRVDMFPSMFAMQHSTRYRERQVVGHRKTQGNIDAAFLKVSLFLY